MRRKELMQRLSRDYGVKLATHQLDYIVANELDGIIKDEDGNRVFSEAHLARIRDILLTRLGKRSASVQLGRRT